MEAIKKYVRAANYLTAAQIYLQDNFFLRRPLSAADIKPRLLGHWGTGPGINFVYAHLNHLVKKYGPEMLFILGPGHGFPALQANLFLEGTLGKYYPEATIDEKGIGYLCRNFSWPEGFPSHSNPGTPGVILEGGELGYGLATAYGAALDNSDLIVACLIGDGEAETGPTATAWHLSKFLNPAESGAVLPILHLNGYKISGPTIFGRMANRDLKALFTGYGYAPIIVEGLGDKIYERMLKATEESYQQIKEIQARARDSAASPSGGQARWPLIILKTPKGWTGIKKLGGQKIEGNCLAHQVVASEAKTDRRQLKAVEKWLRSYRFEELFDPEKGPTGELQELIPEAERRMGESRHARGGEIRQPLRLPTAEQFAEDASVPGTIGSSSMRRAGLYLKEVFTLNAPQKNFRFLSPDETYSNKLDAIFETTSRAWLLPRKEWDKDLAPEGRVIEMLSEHSLQGLMQGYVLTGRHALFASYEAFVPIITSMVDQYLKFIKVAREIPWRGAVPSLNYILTSSGWRQEHNGFSHQNPGFITDMLERPGCAVKVYFPPDGASTLAVLEHCLASTNGLNIIAAGKTLEPRWLTPALAKQELAAGLMTWDFASADDPHLVFAAVGDYLTKEALAAIAILRAEAPDIRTRFVNVLELSAIGVGDQSCRAPINFDDYFTADKPVIWNFHGYPQALKQVLFDRGQADRFFIHGYIENGSTTTPFDMQARNETSRYHLVIQAAELMRRRDFLANDKAAAIMEKYRDKLKAHRAYIREYGVDPEEIANWQWPALPAGGKNES